MRWRPQSLLQTPSPLHLLLLTPHLPPPIKPHLPPTPPGRAALLAAAPPARTATTACLLPPQMAPLDQQQPPTLQQPRKQTPVRLTPTRLLRHPHLLPPQKNQPLHLHHYCPPTRAANSMICNGQLVTVVAVGATPPPPPDVNTVALSMKC